MLSIADSFSSFFSANIARNQAIQFQNEWNACRDHTEKIYLSYDSTNKHCQAGNIELAEFGHEKEKEKKPIYNFSVGYDSTNRVRVSALSRYGTGVLPSKMLALSKLCKHFE